jgi:hypothetical protein
MCGKEHPVERNRDQGTREKIIVSAAPYSLSEDQLLAIEEAEPEARAALCMVCRRQLCRSCSMSCMA